MKEQGCEERWLCGAGKHSLSIQISNPRKFKFEEGKCSCIFISNWLHSFIQSVGWRQVELTVRWVLCCELWPFLEQYSNFASDTVNQKTGQWFTSSPWTYVHPLTVIARIGQVTEKVQNCQAVDCFNLLSKRFQSNGWVSGNLESVSQPCGASRVWNYVLCGSNTEHRLVQFHKQS